MCLFEFLGPRAGGMEIQIFASDIDDAGLKRARAGRYGVNIRADVSPERLARFFTAVDGGYQICSQIRDVVVFTRHDLAKDPPFSRLDLVTCRNVLIYLQAALQQRILRVFHYALRPGGFLLLGASESVGDAADLFTPADRTLKVYQKKDASSLVGVGVVAPALSAPVPPSAPRPQAILPPRPVSTALEVADRKVLERYGPPGVLLNASFEVIQFRGQMGMFLDPIPGKATFNILKLIRADLLAALRSALMDAATLGAPVESGAIAMSEEPHDVQIDVLPFNHGDPVQKCFLVLFKSAPVASSSASDDAPSAPVLNSGDASRLKQVERELLTTREFLDTAVQDLRTANEELQSANEELQSRNEELQSANEELETSKEELTTMNEELHNRMRLLAVSHRGGAAPAQTDAASRDMQDLVGKVLSALPTVMVLLDGQLRAVWVNKAFFDTFEVGAEILGMSLAQVWPGDKQQPELWSEIARVVNGGVPFVDRVGEHPLGAEGRPSVRYSTRRLAAHGEGAAMTLLTMDAIGAHGETS
jgi:two-component system CheB/CheR fusion protein